jgi:hypothetical protein
MRDVAALPTLEKLRAHVLERLCRPDNLDPLQATMQLALITKQGRPCGLFFEVEGPRLLKNYAVWAGEENRILYYNCTGERVSETLLSEAPDPDALLRFACEPRRRAA